MHRPCLSLQLSQCHILEIVCCGSNVLNIAQAVNVGILTGVSLARMSCSWRWYVWDMLLTKQALHLIWTVIKTVAHETSTGIT